MTDLDVAVAVLKRQTVDGVPFEQTYLDAGMVFTEKDIESILFEDDGTVRVLYWWGNSNLFMTFTKDEWRFEPLS